jgi:hypothetical protein
MYSHKYSHGSSVRFYSRGVLEPQHLKAFQDRGRVCLFTSLKERALQVEHVRIRVDGEARVGVAQSCGDLQGYVA